MNSAQLLQAPIRRWCCPNCDERAVTQRVEAHTEFHHCRGLAGLWVPMIVEGAKAKVVAVEREDYIGRELVQLAPGSGRPVMAVQITRDDGEDCVVYAPTARGGSRKG